MPCKWPASTIVCLGGGPSVTAADLTACQGYPVIAINSSIFDVPWADVLYAGDAKWWGWHQGAEWFTGLRYALQDSVERRWPRVVSLTCTGMGGIETAPWGLRSGWHSGHAAINLAVHLGARRIVLLGYDLKPSPDGQHHHHPEHPDGRHPNYARALAMMQTLVEPLAALKVEVVNCSSDTALTLWPRLPVSEVLR